MKNGNSKWRRSLIYCLKWICKVWLNGSKVFKDIDRLWLMKQSLCSSFTIFRVKWHYFKEKCNNNLSFLLMIEIPAAFTICKEINTNINFHSHCQYYAVHKKLPFAKELFHCDLYHWYEYSLTWKQNKFSHLQIKQLIMLNAKEFCNFVLHCE